MKCNHYWLIDSPNGYYSTGTCKYCGAKSKFVNCLEYNGYNKKKRIKACEVNIDLSRLPISNGGFLIQGGFHYQGKGFSVPFSV